MSLSCPSGPPGLDMSGQMSGLSGLSGVETQRTINLAPYATLPPGPQNAERVVFGGRLIELRHRRTNPWRVPKNQGTSCRGHSALKSDSAQRIQAFDFSRCRAANAVHRARIALR